MSIFRPVKYAIRRLSRKPKSADPTKSAVQSGHAAWSSSPTAATTTSPRTSDLSLFRQYALNGLIPAGAILKHYLERRQEATVARAALAAAHAVHRERLAVIDAALEALVEQPVPEPPVPTVLHSLGAFSPKQEG